MKVLVIGSGGREHALTWRIAKSGPQHRDALHAAPGNPGICSLAACHAASSPEDYLALADRLEIDLTIVGPEAPLVSGVVDRFRAAGKAIFGPTAAAAQLEGSKAFSKAFMQRAGIPTASFETVSTIGEARIALGRFGYPVVLKADGLAAGKGVVIAANQVEAESALEMLTPGSRLVIEEFLTGEEVSFIVLSDGKDVLPLEPTQDHKAVFDEDRGPNTGGMGAYCASSILTAKQSSEVMDIVIQPAIAGMRAAGTPFTGFLYAGLMMTAAGPKVLEFNARLGDPETQVLMHRLDCDFIDALDAGARASLKGQRLCWRPEPSVCVVMAAHGYPGTVRTGDAISGIDAAEASGAVVFHAGTRQTEKGIVTAGGRVLGVTASGSDLQEAIQRTYAAVDQVHFDGMHYRKDIGQKGLNR